MSDQTTPRTYRSILLPIVGAAALREAETRVYDRPAPDDTLGRYMCRDGYCALGIIARVTYPDADAPHFPSADDIVDYDLYGYTPWRAADDIISANDHGNLATPGSLTALLDSEVTL